METVVGDKFCFLVFVGGCFLIGIDHADQLINLQRSVNRCGRKSVEPCVICMCASLLRSSDLSAFPLSFAYGVRSFVHTLIDLSVKSNAYFHM